MSCNGNCGCSCKQEIKSLKDAIMLSPCPSAVSSLSDQDIRGCHINDMVDLVRDCVGSRSCVCFYRDLIGSTDVVGTVDDHLKIV